MVLASIRIAFLLAALVASLHVAAAPRFWTLDGVRFSGAFGTSGRATGFFSYDDATQTVSSWNLRVDVFPFISVPPFTYAPGNSTVTVFHPRGAGAPALVFSAPVGAPNESGWPAFDTRELQIGPLTALDGSNANVWIDTFLSKEAIPSLNRVRSISAGSLTLEPGPPSAPVALVDEFHNPALRHYFITASDAEKHALDTGVYPGWQRTGESFKAHAAGSSTAQAANPVCRFYSPPIIEYADQESELGHDSHFFTADAAECISVFRRFLLQWSMEMDNAFQIALPDKTSGTCPVGTIPVYRLFSRRDVNHRYTTSGTTKAAMLAAGYLAEGYGPEGVAMCALP